MKKSTDLVLIDLELTGLDLDGGDRIASLGAIRLGQSLQDDIEKEWFFNPEIQCKPESIRIHGMTDDFLARFPNFKSQFNQVANFIGRAVVLHHCWFRESDDTSTDERFLRSEFIRASGIDISHERWINMKKIAIQLSPEKNSLNDMLDRYGINREERKDHHGALMDTRLTAKVLRAMRKDPVAITLLQKLFI